MKQTTKVFGHKQKHADTSTLDLIMAADVNHGFDSRCNPAVNLLWDDISISFVRYFFFFQVWQWTGRYSDSQTGKLMFDSWVTAKIQPQGGALRAGAKAKVVLGSFSFALSKTTESIDFGNSGNSLKELVFQEIWVIHPSILL